MPPGLRTIETVYRHLRSRVALYLNGYVVLFGLTLYIFLSLTDAWFMGRLKHGWIILESILTPSFQVFSIAILAPLPWMLWPHRSRFWNFVQGLGLSLLTCEIAAVLIVALDIWLLNRAGVIIANPQRIYLVNIAIMAPAMMVLGGLVAARGQTLEENATIREEVQAAKARLLQSQLHPHTLFNALNGLAELIHKDPPAAERSVGHLSDLLRRILRASEQATFPLEDERTIVQNYLHIEGMRLGSRLQVQWEWPDDLDVVQMPPLLLQPLVENAIKHGIAPHAAGGTVLIRASRHGADLSLEVWNTGAPFHTKKDGGIGLRNLRARLDLVYGTTAKFSIDSRSEWTQACLYVPGALLEYPV